MEIHPKEIESVLQLDSRERYMHFIKIVADRREVWGLRTDEGWSIGGATLSDGVEVRYFPVWPRREYAGLCVDYYEGDATRMDLQFFVDVFCEGLVEEGARVGVFPTPAVDPVLIECEPLRSGIQQYIREWYE